MSQPLNVFVVHADASSRAVLLRELAAEGWRAMGARSVEKMLDHARFFLYAGQDEAEPELSVEAPAAILFDWGLPDQGGYQLVYRLRKRLGVKTPPLVAFTSRWSALELRRAIQLGVDGVLPSPVEAPALQSELTALWTRGETLSRRQLLDRAGASLLQHDDALWRIEPRRRWHAGMKQMAATQSLQLRRRRGLEPVAERTEFALTEMLFGGLVTEEGLDEAGLAEMVAHDTSLTGIDASTRKALSELPPEHWGKVVDHARLTELGARMGNRLLQLGVELDPASAVETLPPASNHGHHPPEEEIRLRLLASLLRHADKARQIELYNAFIHDESTQIDAAVSLREILDRDGQTDAIATLRDRMGLPSPPVSSQDIERLANGGRFDAAYFAIAELHPGDPRAIALLQHLDERLRAAGRVRQVQSVYRRAVLRSPDDPVLLLRFARARLDADDWRGAFEPLLALERLAPDEPEVISLKERAIAVRARQLLDAMEHATAEEIVLPPEARAAARATSG